VTLPPDLNLQSGDVTVVTVASFVTFYLRHCDEPHVRQDIVDVVDDYLNRWGAQIRWRKHPKTAQWYPAGSRRLPDLRAYLSGVDADQAWEFAYHGGQRAESASTSLIAGYATPRWQGGFGYLRLALPPVLALATPATFVGFAIAACRTLRPWHGYGGVGFIESPDIAVKQEYEPNVTILAERFSGIEVDDPTLHLRHLTDAIKGVNWLTILDDSWLQRIPEWEGLAAGEPQVTIHRYPGGVILQAGEVPSLGDLSIEPLPPAYVRVARALEPIQVKNHSSFHMAGAQPRMHDERARRWLSRFR
jgi:hypothetical protein